MESHLHLLRRILLTVASSCEFALRYWVIRTRFLIGGSIGEMGLCVKKNKPQYIGVLGYPVARGIVRDGRTGEAGFRAGRNALESRVSWLNQGKSLQPNPVATFDIRGCKSQSGNYGLWGMGSDLELSVFGGHSPSPFAIFWAWSFFPSFFLTKNLYNRRETR